MVDFLQVYHHLPYPLRVAAASARGYTLNRWRYSEETLRLAGEARERESWSQEKWDAWQGERLGQILERAASDVPYYAAQWAERRRKGDRASWAYLENWPVLKKEPLRADPRAFVARDCDLRKMHAEHTSGTSGKPLSLWQSRETTRNWYALVEARMRWWHGVSYRDRWAILGGQLVTPVAQKQPPFWVWNRGMNQLYLSSYHLAPQNAAAYLEALRRHRVTYLLGYASSLESLALFALEQGLEAAPLKVVFSNAEPLYAHQRSVVSQVFGCPVRDTYGMSEVVSAGSECEAGVMHAWPEAGLVEILDSQADQPAGPGQSGRLVCTGLLNRDMPLVRYEVGDRGRRNLEAISCTCGRRLPVLDEIEGRLDDVVITADGRRVGRLDPVFKVDLPILEAQIIQERLDLIRVRFVPAAGFNAGHEQAVIRRLQDRLGEVQVVMEAVDEIPRAANGKFKGVVSLVS